MAAEPVTFEAVYADKGIGGYTPTLYTEHAIAFDGSSSGRADHILWYNSGTGRCWVLRRYGDGSFAPIYASDDSGIGGWDFSSAFDRVIAYDYNHSGKMDHLVCYRPHGGDCAVIAHDGNGNFNAMYNEKGLAGWDFSFQWERMIAFDLERTGRNDALLMYRRALCSFCVITHVGDEFYKAYHDWTWGLGEYTTKGEADYAFAYDWTHSGYLDHILWINTGSNLNWGGGAQTHNSAVVTRQGDKFVLVWSSKDLVGGFPMPPAAKWELYGFPFDFASTGRYDHFAMFWVNHDTFWIMTSPQSDGKWTIPYKEMTKGIGPCDLKATVQVSHCDLMAIAFDYDGTGCNDHILAYNRGTGQVWILRKKGHTPGVPQPIAPKDPLPLPAISRGTSKGFIPVSQSAGQGVGSYDIASAYDHAFSFDYDHSGKRDHLVFHRRGSNNWWIGKPSPDGKFQDIFSSSTGIGGYTATPRIVDRAFAFDYEHNGKMDYICVHKPGMVTFMILKNNNGVFKPVFQHDKVPNCIGDFPVVSAVDRAFAFDYESTGKQDYIVYYCPGTQYIWALKNEGGKFTPAYAGTKGVGLYDLVSPADRAFAYDYDHSGKADHLLLYRPVSGTIHVVKNENGKFTSIFYKKTEPAKCVMGGFELWGAQDRVFPLDFNSSGCMDHVCCYRPNGGIFFVVQNLLGSFSAIYQGFSDASLAVYAGNNNFAGKEQSRNLYHMDGKGIGGYELNDPNDRCLPFDWDSSGLMDHVVVYRPTHKHLWVFKRAEAPPPNAEQVQALRQSQTQPQSAGQFPDQSQWEGPGGW